MTNLQMQDYCIIFETILKIIKKRKKWKKTLLNLEDKELFSSKVEGTRHVKEHHVGSTIIVVVNEMQKD